jgi:hypothetical protein
VCLVTLTAGVVVVVVVVGLINEAYSFTSNPSMPCVTVYGSLCTLAYYTMSSRSICISGEESIVQKPLASACHLRLVTTECAVVGDNLLVA